MHMFHLVPECISFSFKERRVRLLTYIALYVAHNVMFTTLYTQHFTALPTLVLYAHVQGALGTHVKWREPLLCCALFGTNNKPC